MKHKYHLIILVLLLVIISCSIKKTDKVERLIDEGKIYEAKRIITRELKKDPNDIQSNLLMVKTNRKEYYPTYNQSRFLSPLSIDWVKFPTKKMTNSGNSINILKQIHNTMQFENKIAEEYYFLMLYNFYRWRNFKESDARGRFTTILEKLEIRQSEISDIIAFWRVYYEQNCSIENFCEILPLYFQFYPESKLAPLQSLIDIFKGAKIRTDWEIDYELLTNLLNFKRNNPEYSLYADSLFIYKQIKDRIETSSRTQYSNLEKFYIDLMAENLSIEINLYLMKQLALLDIYQGKTEEGLKELDELTRKVKVQYKRDKLIRLAGEHAYRSGDYGLTITKLRQLEKLSKVEMFRLWESFIKVDNDVHAEQLMSELEDRLSNKEKRKAEKILVKYNLSKLKLSEINYVKGTENVAVEGIIINPTLKDYMGIKVKLKLSSKSSDWSKTENHIIGELYKNSKDKFNVFIPYSRNDEDLSVTVWIAGYNKIVK